MAANARTYDLVVFGATGFVGRLLAGYLAEHAPPGPASRWPGGPGRGWRRSGPGCRRPPGTGRARGRRRRPGVAGRAGRADPRAGRPRSAPTRGTGCRWSRPARAAGTHYADLTGEVLFVRDAIARVDAVARDTGARIVHACGYDSIPSDLGACCWPRGPRPTAPAGCATSGWWPPSAAGSAAARSTRCAPSSRRCRTTRSLRRVAGRPVRAEPRPGRRAGHPPAAGRRPARAAAGRPVDGAVRDGAVQHPHRPAQQRAAGLGVRPGPPLRRGHGRRPRPGRRRHGGRGHRRAGRRAGRHELRADPRAARPRAARRRAAARARRPGGRAGSGWCVDADDRGRPALPGHRRRPGRPRLRRDRRHAGGERPGAGPGRRPAARPRRLADPGHGAWARSSSSGCGPPGTPTRSPD